MKLSAILIILLSFQSWGEEHSPVTFQTLLSKLSQQQIEQIPELAYLAELKKNQKGDESSALKLSEEIDYLSQFGPEFLPKQLYILDRLERQLGQNQLWIDLATQIFEIYGVKSEDKTHHELLLWTYYDLAKVYYKGPETYRNPVMAFKILTTCAKEKNCSMLREQLLYYLRGADYLPNTRHLRDLWDDLTSNFQPMSQKQVLDTLINDKTNTNSETDIEQPDDANFQQCQNTLGATDQVVAMFIKQQQKILSDDSLTPNKLQRAYDSIAAMNDVGNYQNASFKFETINIQSVLTLSLGLMTQANHQSEVLIKYPQNFPDYVVEIKSKDVPAILVFSQIIELFQLEVLCHKNWLLIKPQSDQNNPDAKKFLISNFITHFTLDENKQTATINWGEEFKYEGETKNQLPHGWGTLTLFGDQAIGQFKQGLLNGSGERISKSGHMKMKGQFKDGVLHGTGEYISNGAYLSDQGHFSGNFKNGEFYGIGSIYLDKYPYANYSDPEKKADTLIQYTGPMSASKPSGEGQCRYQKMQYACTFHQGYLIAYEGISLLPVKTSQSE